MHVAPLKFVAALFPLTNPLAVAAEVERVANGSREVLDVGCCGGALGEFLIERGFSVTGVDWDPYYLATAKSRGYAKTIQADLRRPLTAIADGSYPVVVASEVIEHIPDAELDMMVRGLHRISGGWLVATVPDYANWASKILDFLFFSRGWLDLFNMGCHYQRFTRASFTALLERSGFQVEKIGPTMAGTGMIVVARKKNA